MSTARLTLLVLRVLTLRVPADGRTIAGESPDGDISLRHVIAPIGTKGHAASGYGPASQLNPVDGRTGRCEGRLHLHVGALVAEGR